MKRAAARAGVRGGECSSVRPSRRRTVASCVCHMSSARASPLAGFSLSSKELWEERERSSPPLGPRRAKGSQEERGWNRRRGHKRTDIKCYLFLPVEGIRERDQWEVNCTVYVYKRLHAHTHTHTHTHTHRLTQCNHANTRSQ